MFESNTQINDLLHTDWNPKDFEKSKEVYIAYLQTSEIETRKTISKTGKLSNIGIISFSERNYRDFDVDMSIFHYLNGLDERPLTDKFYTHVDLINNFVIDIKDHSFDDEQTELLLKLIQREGGTNIIFHGAPGVGKTEFAKSIANCCGLV